MKTTKKDFRVELEKLISKHSDSILANYISKCISEFDAKLIPTENTSEINTQENKQNPVQIKKQEQIPANIGNQVSTGWSNPFAGTSWGV